MDAPELDALRHSVREALDRPWVLDIDASIKPLYGRQDGVEIGSNPSKPMRPSHVLHTFRVSKLRLVAQQFTRQGWSRPANDGCQMVQVQLQLHG